MIMKKDRYKNYIPAAAAMLLMLVPAASFAQTYATDALKASDKAVMVPFDLSSTGVEQPVRWGIDTAWDWNWWPLRATNHMQECVSLGRVTIDPRTSGSYSSLSSDQTANFDKQLSWLVKSGVTDLFLLAGNASGQAWQTSFRTSFIADLAMAVDYLKSKGYNVIAISPFNEPDYGSNNAPSVSEMVNVAKLMHENSTLKSIDICGPSTLNGDYGRSWWPQMKDAYQIGNTHQLAGSFDNYDGFYRDVQASGRELAGDEMHNTNDALIAMNYGLKYGIWWSDYGGYTRAELGRASNDGSRIAYQTNASAFTSAAVFKRKSQNLAEAFLGTSERQATASAYTFISQDRLAYFDGKGPYYDYSVTTQGGTGYQTGQSNSETVVEITDGEDVPVAQLSGNFKLMNKATGLMLTADNGSVTQAANTGNSNQIWRLNEVTYSQASDFAYTTVASAANLSLYLDAPQWQGDNGANPILYAGSGNTCEQWHFRYMGDGYYVLTNSNSGLSLEGSSDNTDLTPNGVTQWARTGSDRQLWKLIPSTGSSDQTAPAAPTGLKATAMSGAVRLDWNANTESDLLGYMVYRYNQNAGVWETIGRQVKGESFVDNMQNKYSNYRYRIRAIDRSWNKSEPSNTAVGKVATGKAMIASWPMTANINDTTANRLDAAGRGVTFDNDGTMDAAVFDGKSYVSLPYHAGDMRNLTFTAWVKMASGLDWQRIFDFGRNTDNYLMLTSDNGSVMRFEICKDGEKQGLNARQTLPFRQWTHVALTIADDSVKLYINGKLNASTTAITIKPSDVKPTVCYIGRSMFDADPMLNASVTGVSLYNYALTDNEVNAAYRQRLINDADSLLMKPMNKDTKSTLTVAISVAKAAVGSGDDDLQTEAISNMQTAAAAARTSIAVYEPLGQQLSKSQSLASSHRQTDAQANTDYSEAYDLTLANYEYGEYADSDIAAQVIRVKAFTNAYLMADASKNTSRRQYNITYLLDNDNFADNNTDGWTVTTGRSGYNGTVDNHCLEFFNTTFDIGQTLYGMPAGTYRLQAQAFYRNGLDRTSTDVNALLYVNDSTAAIMPISSGATSSTGSGTWSEYIAGRYVPDDMDAAATAFLNDRYKPTLKVNVVQADISADDAQFLKVGMKKTVHVTSDWTVMRYFKLYYNSGLYATGIESIETADHQATGAVYDLSGRKVADSLNGNRLPKGIYISGGKKFVVE